MQSPANAAPSSTQTAAVAVSLPQDGSTQTSAQFEQLVRRLLTSTIIRDNPPAVYAPCLATVLKIVSNILENPDDPKFRLVKARNPAFQRAVVACRGGTDLLTLTGFLKRVKDFEEYWTWSTDAECRPLAIPPAAELRLVILSSLLAHHAVKSHNEAELARVRKLEASRAEEERKRQVLAQIDEDRERRKLAEARRKAAAAAELVRPRSPGDRSETQTETEMMPGEFKEEDESDLVDGGAGGQMVKVEMDE
ncbi:hypothetical protein M427DRAFT_52497 [Gonapodya prolifera JEL478]|uniref:PUB domain-containing protein n=1 Tax=Gonapodya prolifera (strain JEL478) TaxID=1344416 RepID=A0A139AU36_GONPJ|nr:hypothetical protein M427DRAFT_52497 [Gonapodya prolifera JEL478]|eukprot:KXS20256.1 hypothetical protein M427DRAFT_52497 [Gonapodya prolifera JEL478]